MGDQDRFTLPSDNPGSAFYRPPPTPQPQITTFTPGGDFVPRADPSDFNERMARYLPDHPAHPFYAPRYEPHPVEPPIDSQGASTGLDPFRDRPIAEPPIRQDADGLPPRSAPWDYDPWAEMQTSASAADPGTWLSQSADTRPSGYEPPPGWLPDREDQRAALERAIAAFRDYADRASSPQDPSQLDSTSQRPPDPSDFNERMARYSPDHPAHPFYAPRYEPAPIDPLVFAAAIDPNGYLPFNPMAMTSDLTAVDTRDFVDPRDRTALGYPRDRDQYWDVVYERDRVARDDERVLSDENRARVARGEVPLVDPLWVARHAATAPYLTEPPTVPLRHHHWDQGPIAFAIPEPVHQQCSGLLHWVTSRRQGP